MSKLLAAVLIGTAVLHGEAARPSHVLSLSSHTRALVVSPHPDDAVLGAGGLIARIVERHGSVQIVEMTSGDAFPGGLAALRHVSQQQLTAGSYRAYGTIREREVAEAMSRLGVARSRVRLLGFPDEGLCELAGDSTAAAVFTSPYTHRDRPPASELVETGARYRAADVRQELEDLLVAFRPTLVVLPNATDLHPDHCATHMLVHDAVAMSEARGVRAPSFAHYVIHGNAPRADDPRAVTLHLTAAVRAEKTHAIEAYRSQETVMPDFMRGFEGADEILLAGGREAPAACWCRGSNIAAIHP
jgi:LmbE family N-acetylglucosaminyl deacetylase